MMFLFLDESGDTKKPSKRKDADNPGHFFALGGFLINENYIREVENYIEQSKRQVFGDELYEEKHPELKAAELFSRKYINNKQRQNFVKLISDKLEFYHRKGYIYTFGTIFDKRKTRIYKESDNRHKIDLWYYNLAIHKMLRSISHCIENKFNGAKCMIIIDRMFAEKALLKSILKYFCGNPTGKSMNYMHRHPLFAESKNSPMVQFADFIIGALRFWEEYEDNNYYETKKSRKSRLPYANSKIRKSEYYASGDGTTESIKGIEQAFR